MEIIVVQDSLLNIEADAIVNAANSLGVMGRGISALIKEGAGSAVEEDVKKLAPVPVGKAVLTKAGNLKFKGIIHAPTMEIPGIRIVVVNVSKATKAALKTADDNGFLSVAMPGMGTGVGGVKKDAAASIMIETIQDFKAQNLKKVLLVDIDYEMVNAWKAVLAEKGHI